MTPPASTPTPFSLHVDDRVLDDLGQRLARTRWPDEAPGPAWSTGSSVAYIQALVEHGMRGTLAMPRPRRWWRREFRP